MVFEYSKAVGIDEQETFHEEKTIRNQFVTDPIFRTSAI